MNDYTDTQGDVWEGSYLCQTKLEDDAVHHGYASYLPSTRRSGNEFEVVLLAAAMFAGPGERLATLIRETHRILQGGGCLYFTVEEAAGGGGSGWTQRAIYELLRDGFDVVGLKRPPWWKFGSAGRTMTVCARRKNWRNRGTPIVGAAMPVSSAMLSPRERSK